MSWLRLDDGFASHPKIAALTDRELRVWMRVLCYCARHQDPSVDRIAVREVKGLTPKMVARFEDVGLLDRHGDAPEVHDWSTYLPKDATGAERQARWRSRQAQGVTDTVTPNVTEPLPRARAHPRSRPVPSPGEAKASPQRPRDEIWDALAAEMREQPSTRSERGRWNRAVSELREAGATPDDIHRRVREYRKRWPDVSLTVTALAANWGSLKPKETLGSACPECGMGGGLHVEDCTVSAPLTEGELKDLGAEMARRR